MNPMARFSMVLAGSVLVACGSGTDHAQGTEQGRCYPNGTCNAGLTCFSATCVNTSTAGTGGALGHDGALGNGGSGPDASPGHDVGGPDAPLERDLGDGTDAWNRDLGPNSSGGATGAGGSSGSGGRPLDAATAGTGGGVGSRQVDLVVMVDDSPSMAPKVSKMNAQFPKLIAALKDPSDGTLPDLRVAVIDSDLGTGNAYSSGSCGPKALADGTYSPYGDLGRFQMLTSPTACAFSTGAEFLEYRAGKPVNYAGDINTVFACLAGNLGTLGCGEEHQLQAFEFALVAKGVGNERQQADFLRPNALLGLLFLTDEDDCSAATMAGMFGEKPELRGESASLRCATRAHMCGGRKLADSPPGYPTNAAFTHAFNDCQPRMGDECAVGTDTSVATDCNPLKSVKTLADEIKGLKPDPDHQILVAGIFGWPLNDADMATAQYQIAPVPNPNPADTQHPTVYDYWPVCYDPNNAPTLATTDRITGFDWTAAGLGATGGLRESAFIDEFGANGMKFSICQPDFSASMTAFGNAIAKQMPSSRTDGGLADAPLVGPGAGGSGGGGSTGTADASCGSVTSNTSHVAADILLVLDRSGSMDYSILADSNCNGVAGCTARWPALTSAVDAALASTASSINWGLKLYSSTGNGCTVSNGVEVPISTTAQAAIPTLIGNTTPGGNTPTAQSIQAATAYLKTVTDGNNHVILLATDGEPTCAPGSSSSSTSNVQGTVDAITAADQAGFPVYVIGIGPSVGNLDNFAQAGGTGHYYPASSPADLTSAFAAISQAVTTCTFVSPTAPPDPNKVTVYLDKNLVPKDATNGWSFGATSKTIILNGTTCAAVTSGAASTVQLLFGCAGSTPGSGGAGSAVAAP